MPPKFTLDELQHLMSSNDRVRSLSVIAHVDHGKSTVVDALIAKAGLIAADAVGKRVLDSSEQSKAKGITIKSTGNSMVFDHETQGQFLINLADTPGHVDFSSEVTAALRITDGALVVVDCIEGVCVQTETVLRQALAERVKPVLMLNKVDRAFLELQMTPEEAYQNFRKAVESVNVVVSPFEPDDFAEEFTKGLGPGKLQMDPAHGNVAFGSGLQQWAFTLGRFAKIYAAKFGVNVDEMSTKLWGDHFLDVHNKVWLSGNPDKCLQAGLSRAFVQFCLEPIQQVVEAAMQGKQKKLDKMLKTMGVVMKQQELEELSGKDLVKAVLSKWLPVTDALLDLIVIHLPSPVRAQKYRAAVVYDGPTDDVACQAIASCDKDGPLMVYISKMVPNADYSRFYAFGRVFSGTLVKGQTVTVLRPNYEPGKKHDMDVGVRIGRVSVMVGKAVESLDHVPAGNNVLIAGVDNYLIKTGTITTIENAYCFKTLKYAVSPVVRVAVAAKVASDLPKLVEGLRKLTKSDPLVICSQEESGEHIVAGAGELHLEIVLHDLQELFLKDVPLKVSEPVVSYRETVTKDSSSVALAKSPNGLNRLFCMARPVPVGLAEAIDRKEIQPQDDFKTRARVLADDFGFDVTEARKLWSFGPDENGPNLLLDATRSVAYLPDIKDSCVAGFQWATKEGPLCEEPTRGVVVRFLDAQIHRDAAHRGSGQILPATRRVTWGSMLLAEPVLQEPFYQCDVSTVKTEVGAVYDCVARRRGIVIDEVAVMGSPVVVIKCHVPVATSFGLSEALRSATSGRAFAQCSFSHWNNCSDVETLTLVAGIRKRKGLEGDVPPSADEFNDRL